MRRVSLICLPFVGGSCGAYRGLVGRTAAFIDVVAVELPGRGKRFREPFLTDVRAMVEDIFVQVRPLLDHPYALYGHSMGAYLAFLLSKLVLEGGLRPPDHLFVSGRGGPCLKRARSDRHVLPDEHFAKLLKGYGGIPDVALRDEELAGILIPILRADFRAYDAYTYEPGAPFTIPLTVMIGDSDSINQEDALLWQKETVVPVTVKIFPGGHFYIHDNWPAIGHVLSTALEGPRR